MEMGGGKDLPESRYLPNGFTNMVMMIMKRSYCAAL
jgi:hypothetical protein